MRKMLTLVLMSFLWVNSLGCGGDESGEETATETNLDAEDGPGQFGNSADATVEVPVTETTVVDFGVTIEEKNSDLTEDVYKIYFNQFIYS